MNIVYLCVERAIGYMLPSVHYTQSVTCFQANNDSVVHKVMIVIK